MKDNLNINELLVSKTFDKIVNYIIYLQRNTIKEDMKDDIKQVCAIAVIDATDTYDDQKCNNFWAYAYKRMLEYAKNELNLQTHIVHIPYNRMNNGNKKYKNVEHSYISIDNDFSWIMVVDSLDKCKPFTSRIDVKNAIATLDEFEKNVFLMRNGVAPTDNGSVSYDAIANTLGVPYHKVQRAYPKIQKKLQKYFNI